MVKLDILELSYPHGIVIVKSHFKISALRIFFLFVYNEASWRNLPIPKISPGNPKICWSVKTFAPSPFPPPFRNHQNYKNSWNVIPQKQSKCRLELPFYVSHRDKASAFFEWLRCLSELSIANRMHLKVSSVFDRFLFIDMSNFVTWELVWDSVAVFLLLHKKQFEILIVTSEF